MKCLRAVLLLAVVVPIASLDAQTAASGPPANPITTALRNRTAGLRRNIAQAFDSIPESKFGYKPTPAQLSIGYIAQHVAEDNYFFCNNFGDKKATLADEDTSTPDSVKAQWPREKLIGKLKESNAFCDEAIAQLDDSKLAEAITVQGPNNTSRQVARANYVVGHALDLADHYSQLANYMRLNGIVPPTALPRKPRSGN
jgi:uncharacterized damage-inducible protein DinB